MGQLFAVIMAGGRGTRFWPASRASRPKQLLPLAGDDNESLLAATVRRLHPRISPNHILVVTADALTQATRAALSCVPAENILSEPVGRNTAPCIAWATEVIAKRDPEATVVVLPSDHFIVDEARFRAVLDEAVACAERGHVTTVGIVPTRPETGYGYIEVGAELTGHARRVARFVEKPDRARAEAFVAEGPTKYVWNAGMFIFRAKDMQALLAKYLPAIAQGATRMASDPSSVHSVFPTLESISIDHGVMEKASNLAVLPGDFGWNDVGSWQSAWELAVKDAHGNALGPDGLAFDSSNNLVRRLGSARKVIALVGMNNTVVVETDDAILIIDRERAQDVRLVVDALTKSSNTELL